VDGCWWIAVREGLLSSRCRISTRSIRRQAGIDYAAYCGVSSNAERLVVLVAQIGVKKPLCRKDIGKASAGNLPDSDCAEPHWDRQPARVTFLPKAGEKFTVNVGGHFADAATESTAEEQ
jgi:hypothetical protein